MSRARRWSRSARSSSRDEPARNTVRPDRCVRLEGGHHLEVQRAEPGRRSVAQAERVGRRSGSGRPPRRSRGPRPARPLREPPWCTPISKRGGVRAERVRLDGVVGRIRPAVPPVAGRRHRRRRVGQRGPEARGEGVARVDEAEARSARRATCGRRTRGSRRRSRPRRAAGRPAAGSHRRRTECRGAGTPDRCAGCRAGTRSSTGPS